jgi:hypothetical protein
MDEEKFVELTNKSPDIMKQMLKCESPEDISCILEEKGIKTTSSEAKKIFCVIKYFELKDEEKPETTEQPSDKKLNSEQLNDISAGLGKPMTLALKNLIKTH